MSGIVALLQSALSLLMLVQSSPALPPSLQTTAINMAQQAITFATSQISSPVNSLSNASTFPGTPTPVKNCPAYGVECAVGYHTGTSSGTDANGCPLPPTCVPDPVQPTPVKQCSSSGVECAVGYHTGTSSGADANGCPLPPTCVPDPVQEPTIVGGSCIGNGEMTLSWYPVQNATSYAFTLLDSATGRVVTATTTSGTAWTGPASPDTYYDWTVAAISASGESGPAEGPQAWCPASNSG